MLIRESELPQGSPEWLEWRRAGVGGSTVYPLACHAERISGVDEGLLRLVKPQESPPAWVPSPLSLYWEYFGVQREVSEFHTARGHRLEPVARELLEDTLGEEVAPLCVYPDERPRCRVSLDGYAFGSQTLMEVKAPLHRWERLPDYVLWQTAYQAAVCIEAGLAVQNIAILEVFVEEGRAYCKRWPVDGVLVPGYPEVLGSALMLLAERFYENHIAVGIAPGLTTSDAMEIAAPEWLSLAEAYARAKATLAEAEEAERQASIALVQASAEFLDAHPMLRGGGVSVSRTFRRGSIDYKRAALQKYSEQELEAYRRSGTSPVTIRTTTG
jgi:hypothetical protein